MHRFAKWLLIGSLLSFLFSRTASGVVDLDLWHELALALEVTQTGHVPWQDHFAYTISKYALAGATEMFARAMAPGMVSGPHVETVR